MTYQDPECTIFVSNVDNQVTNEHLWELFLQAGPLRHVHIPVDRKTGKNRTFAFVSYRDVCSVPYACELFNTLRLFNRPIYCKTSKDGSNRGDQSSPITPNSNAKMNGSMDRSTPVGQNPDERRLSQDSRNNYDSRGRESNRNSSFTSGMYSDNSRDRYNDNPRGRYNDNSRDRCNDSARDRYSDSSRERYDNRYDDSSSNSRHGDDLRDRLNSRSNSNDRRHDNFFGTGSSFQERGQSPERYNSQQLPPNSPNSPSSSNASPMFMKAVNQLSTYRRGSGGDNRNNPSNFGPIRNDNSNYKNHRRGRKKQTFPY